MLSGRGLCDELITRPEESYRLCCVVVCDLETSRLGVPYIFDISSLRVKDLNCLCEVQWWNDEWAVYWKKVRKVTALAQFKVISVTLFGAIKENHEKFSVWKFELIIS